MKKFISSKRIELSEKTQIKNLEKDLWEKGELAKACRNCSKYRDDSVCTYTEIRVENWEDGMCKFWEENDENSVQSTVYKKSLGREA